MGLGDTALQFLKEGKLDELENELHRISETYRFCNRVRESAEETAQGLLKEKQELVARVVQLEVDKARALQAKAANGQIMQQTLAQINAQAQARMQEIEQLRAQLRALRDQESKGE